MCYKKLDELRKELGLAQKGTKAEKGESYTTIHLNFRLKTEDAKRLLLLCDAKGITEGIYGRNVILKAIAEEDRDE